MAPAQSVCERVQQLGMRKALVVHSCGLDELTPLGPADVVELAPGGGLREYSLDPADLGVPRCEAADLAGGGPATNAAILRDAFGGARGAVTDALNLNAGYALAACEVASSPQEGFAMAQEAQRSGAAARVMAAWVETSQAALQQEQEQEKRTGVNASGANGVAVSVPPAAPAGAKPSQPVDA